MAIGAKAKAMAHKHVAELCWQRAHEFHADARRYSTAAVNWHGVAERHRELTDHAVYDALSEATAAIADAYVAQARRFEDLAREHEQRAGEES